MEHLRRSNGARATTEQVFEMVAARGRLGTGPAPTRNDIPDGLPEAASGQAVGFPMGVDRG